MITILRIDVRDSMRDGKHPTTLSGRRAVASSRRDASTPAWNGFLARLMRS